MESLGDRNEIGEDAGPSQHDCIGWRFAFRDARSVHRMGLEDLVRLLREGVDGLRRDLCGGLKGLRFQNRLADLVWIGIRNFWLKPMAPQLHGPDVLSFLQDRQLDYPSL